MSSLDSVSTENSKAGILKPSDFYNREIIERQRQSNRVANLRKIEEANSKLRTNDKKQEKEQKGLFGFSSFEKFRTSFRGSSKNDAIIEWEQRQENKKNEKGLFGTMDAKGYGNNHGNFEGWGKNKTREVVRTVYVPVRVNSNSPTGSRSASRTSTELPPYEEGQERSDHDFGEGHVVSKRVGIYPKCPSPDTDEEIEKAKLNSWIEYTENQELSVDEPTFLQRKRSSTLASSLAMGTLFEGYNEEDSYVESDEINIIPSCTEYDGDFDSLEEQEDLDSDLDDTEKAMRLTRPFNIGAPVGRRCPKNRSTARQDPETTIGQYGVLESKAILRIRGGAKSTSGDSVSNTPKGRRSPKATTTTDSNIGKPRPSSVLRLKGGAKSGSSSDNGAMEITNTDHVESKQGTSEQTPRHTPENFLKRNSAIVDYMETVSPARKRNRESSKSPGQPESEADMTMSYSRRGRSLIMYFEKFKSSYKKKLTSTAQSELDIGVEMINELIAEICAENMCILGRYLELKEAAADNRKKVDFAPPLPKQKERFERTTEEIQTSDTDMEGPKKNKRRRKKKAEDSQAQSLGAETAQPGTDTEAATSGTGGSRPGSRNNSRKKEKEILEKCREQDAPIKYVVTTGDKTAEETKKILWTQVVAKNKAPNIKQAVVLQGGDLLITPADEETRTAMESLVKEGFGITKTGARLPRIIIYDVDRLIKPEELPGTIVSQNPELELTEDDRKGITPSFRTGPKETDVVHWVCEVKPETFAKLNNKRLYIGYSVCRAKEYLNITICNKCQKFGHIAAKCKESVDTCSYCAEKGHRVENCSNKDKQPKCVNCKGPYTARHMGCTFRAQQVRNLVRNTTYN